MVSRKWMCVFAASVFLTCIVSQPASAQVLYGSITGTVVDPSGALLPGASIAITHLSTGAVREAVSDEQGRFTAVNLAAGTYNITSRAPGFRAMTLTGIGVTINNVTRVTLRLEVGQISDLVTVTGSTAVLQTDRSDTRAELTSKAVVELPLVNYRNYQSLIDLVPGATPSAEQNSMGASPQRSLTTNINGTNRNNNNTRVDGAINVYIWLPHHTLYNPPIEAIDNVNISTSSYDAEQGMAGGAAVTVSTKSGSNEIHGTGYWYHDNQHLYARPYYYQQGVTNPKLPKNITNIPGFTIGGPIKKDKLFYFFSYERNWLRQNAFTNTNVPPADVRKGDFSAYTGLGLIYDPLTGDAEGNNRTPFPDNKIPASRISPIWDMIQQMCPLPNQKGTDSYNLSGNYFASASTGMDRDNYDVKINYNVTNKLMIWGKYSDMEAYVFGEGALGDLVGPALGQNGKGDVYIRIPTFGFNYTKSPTFLIDGVFGYTRFQNIAIGPDYGKNWGSEVWKIPGTNGGNVFADDIRYSGMPQISTGFAAWGNNASSNPNFYNDRSYTFTTNFTKVRGAHEFRWGIDLVRHEMNHWQPETANPRGYIMTSGNATVLRGQVSRSVHQYASGLLGIIGSANKSVQFFDMTTREWQEGFYFRDRWQVSRNFTLNLGLRYEYYPLMSRADGRGLERWDPGTNIVTIGGLGSVDKANGMTTSKRLFAPRLGIAWRLAPKTVLRTGYGLTWNPMVLSRPLKGLYPATITNSWVAPATYGYYGFLANGIPDVPTPDISTGSTILPPTVTMGMRSPWAGQIDRGYIHSWNFTVEREFPASLLVSVGYVGNQTVRQFLDIDVNSPTYLGGGATSRPLYATQGRLIEAYMWDGWGNANYHSLQVAINKNLSHGLFMKGAYTWSKAINMADEDGWASLPMTNVPGELDRNRAVAGYDRPHMLTMGWVYELPAGKGKRYNLSGVANQVLGGWRLNGAYYAYSGTPFTVTASSASLNTPGSSQTADLIGTVSKIGSIGPGTQYYDVAAFRDPNFQRPAGTYRFGTMGRNALRGPGFSKVDLVLFKDFRLTERFMLQFRAESFNFTNTPRFNNPNANVSNMTLNQTTGQITNVNDFMAITSAVAGHERKFRFGLRLSF